jgi:TPP-dependent pyruvate/acetoin dehydrogenase alpha subunit
MASKKNQKKEITLPIEKEDLISMYRQMMTTRRFEERASQEYLKRNIPGIVHCLGDPGSHTERISAG